MVPRNIVCVYICICTIIYKAPAPIVVEQGRVPFKAMEEHDFIDIHSTCYAVSFLGPAVTNLLVHDPTHR